ncbi:MAG: hypothetical protein IJW92_06215 [Clostridia bacterium]|nr:hypothetical protein [Clostridia bacterium]
MEWIVVFGIILILFLIPYIRILVKRLTLLIKIKRFCTRNHCQLIKTHFFWFLGSRKGEKCDFYIVKNTAVYSVKLWAMKKYHTELFFTDNGRYFIRSFIAMAAGMQLMKTPVDSKWKPVPKFQFRYRFREDWYIKEFKPILLINPTCYEVRFTTQDKKSEIIGRGQLVNDFYLYTLSSFLDELEDRK